MAHEQRLSGVRAVRVAEEQQRHCLLRWRCLPPLARCALRARPSACAQDRSRGSLVLAGRWDRFVLRRVRGADVRGRVLHVVTAGLGSRWRDPGAVLEHQVVGEHRVVGDVVNLDRLAGLREIELRVPARALLEQPCEVEFVAQALLQLGCCLGLHLWHHHLPPLWPELLLQLPQQGGALACGVGLLVVSPPRKGAVLLQELCTACNSTGVGAEAPLLCGHPSGQSPLQLGALPQGAVLQLILVNEGTAATPTHPAAVERLRLNPATAGLGRVSLSPAARSQQGHGGGRGPQGRGRLRT
mmetsp:Transcript_15942/g.41229  ORF Transcript_15942/g.41229 Transcript_15942/m.41229 type:complete len:299 (+) Transcript_15942:857-1753(+)